MCYCKHATGPPPPPPASCSPGWGAGETSGEGDGWGAGVGTSGEGDGTSAGEGVGAGLGSKGAGAGATLGEGAGASSAGEGAGATGGSSSMTVVCKGCGAAVVGVAFVDALAGLAECVMHTHTRWTCSHAPARWPMLPADLRGPKQGLCTSTAMSHPRPPRILLHKHDVCVTHLNHQLAGHVARVYSLGGEHILGPTHQAVGHRPCRVQRYRYSYLFPSKPHLPCSQNPTPAISLSGNRKWSYIAVQCRTGLWHGRADNG